MGTIEQATGFLVVRTARSMKKMLDIRLLDYGITSAQLTVLNALVDNNGASLSEIGKIVYLDRPAITGLADRLERDGLVERRRTTTDRRIIRLHLTQKGTDLLDKIGNLATEVDQELVQNLSNSELMAFRSLLNRIWRQASKKR